MFSYIQSKFQLPPVQSENAFKVETDIITSYFSGGHKIVEICAVDGNWLASAAAQYASGQSNPVIWLYLDKNDVDPGRFWTLLVMGMRQFQKEIGRTVLNTINDHHAVPAAAALDQFARELSDMGFTLVLEGIQQVNEAAWWAGFIDWLKGSGSEFRVLMLNNGQNHSGAQFTVELPAPENATREIDEQIREWIASLDSEVSLALTAMDSWWLPWLKVRFGEKFNPDVFEAIQTTGMIKMVGNELILPAAALLTLLRSRVTESDIRPMTSEILDLVDWLEEQGEDLERIRYHILVKDFELAAELFERQAETWLNQQVDVLSILFWLKEIPSVLLTSRATLCWLVAMCARRLGLALQVKTYLDLAENNLMTFTRFSCSQEQWRTIEINEQGVTVGELLQKIESLRKE